MRKRSLLHILLLGLVFIPVGVADKKPLLGDFPAPFCDEKPDEAQPQNDLQPDKVDDR